jgi:hypothetical protein
MAEESISWMSKTAMIVGLLSSGMFIHSLLTAPKVPKCPQCGLSQSNPGDRFSKCMSCGQLMDWKVRA